MGTDGFEFVEYAAPVVSDMAALFHKMGFGEVARHRSKQVTLHRQGEINFILNHEPHSFAQAFARVHGPSVCAFAIRVKDAADSIKRATALGAKAYHGRVGPMELNIPAIRGIGGSLIYLVDRYADRSIYDVDFISSSVTPWEIGGAGLTHVDHLTHNAHKGRMDQWADFYRRLFNFREIRYFNIRGQKTGLHSRALVSPCGKIRIPINEPVDRQSQVQEYLAAYHGEGIQHIALASRDIYASIEGLKKRGV
ncbi:MAG: 4-hydroxyphenylpyruvate dioxygenase family protein, partial [Candidatus Binatia bacterium]